MDTVLFIARLLLAGVFAVSAAAKLADRAGSREALAGFGVPARFVIPGAILLPLVELALALLLLPRATAWWGALGALVLLLAFTAVIGGNFAKGRRPDCHCFGGLHSEPIGPGTLVRDGFLVAVAAFVLIGGWDDPGPGAIAWLGDLSTGETVAVLLAAVAAAAVGVEGWFLTQLLGQHGRLLLRLEAIEKHVKIGPLETATTSDAPAGLPAGTLAPAFRLDGIYGETLTLDALRAAGKPVLLVFTDPGCGPCNALMPDLRRWQDGYASYLTVAVIGRGTVEANRAKAAEHGLAIVLLQGDMEVATTYRATKTPSAVIVNADGTIGGPVAAGSDAIPQLVADAIRVRTPAEVAVLSGERVGVAAVENRPAGHNGLADGSAPTPQPMAAQWSSIGEPAPAITLADLDGKEVNLSDFRGQPTLVLFWNPGCGFCQRMTGELKAWEAAPSAGAPKLLVVSTGTVDANKAMGLASTVVLDQSFASGRAFGATATPSAVLVDADGTIASDVVVGAPRVMALASGEDPQTLTSDAPAVRPVPPVPAIPAVKQGDPAPAITLNDLDGKKFVLAKHKSQPLALLFWNPACGFCQQMVDRLKEWEENPPDGAPRVVLVSEGSVDANREFGLRSRILLDEGLVTGRVFGATGTPSAVLIDAERRIASDVAAGGRAVLNLIGYVPVACRQCLEECRQRGGGDACQSVCQMAGRCV